MKQPIYSNNDMSKLFKTDIKGGSKWFQGLRRHFRQVRLSDSLLNVKQGEEMLQPSVSANHLLDVLF